MSAAVTLLASTFSTSNGTKNAVGSPAVGDLIVILTAHSSNTASVAPTDDNTDGLGTYTQAESALRGASADILQVWVRDALIGAAASTTFTHAPGTTNGGGLAVLKVTGMTRVGSGAKLQSAKQENQAAGGTPTPVFGSAALTGNPVIGIVYNGTSPATMTARSSPAYSELLDDGYSVPTRGVHIMSIDSGETGTSIAWGGTSATAFGDIVIELDSSASAAEPAAGALALTGLAPSALAGTIGQPSAGAAIASGAQPVIIRGSVLQPAAGAATITGQAPSGSLGTVLQPDAGALVTTGQAPALLRGSVVQPGSGALTLAGLAPDVLRAVLAQPGAGALTLAGVAPAASLGSIAQPGAGALVVTGLAPSIPDIPVVAQPGAGSLSLTGIAATSSVGAVPLRTLAASPMGYLRTRRIVGLDPNTTNQPEPGALTFAGLEPASIIGYVVAPGPGALVMTGLSVTVTQTTPSREAGDLAASTLGYLRTRRFVALFDESIAPTPGAGAMVITGQEPVALIGTVTQPAAGALTIDGAAPALGVGVAVPAGAIVLTGAAPAALVGGDAGPDAAQLTLTGLAPVALVNILVQPEAGALAFTGHEPSIVASSPDFVPDAGALAIFGQEPTIVVTSDGILSAKYLGGGRRKNVPFKPIGKKKDEPKKKAEAKPSPLLLGLLARGLALPVEEPAAAIVTPQLPEIVLAPLAPAPLPTPEELLQARVDSLEQQMQAMRDEIAALRAPVAAPSTPRDPLAEAMHAILPAIGRPIDLDAGPPDDDDEPPDEAVEIEPPPPAPPPRPKMTREQIERENERRAAMAAELLL